MSWQELFNTLPETSSLQEAFPRFQQGVTELLRKYPNAVLDTDVISSSFDISSSDALDLLVLMEKENLVQTHLFWECKNGYGTTAEADAASQFPTFIECERCGEVHEFDQNCVAVHFIATDSLLNSIAPDS